MSAPKLRRYLTRGKSSVAHTTTARQTQPFFSSGTEHGFFSAHTSGSGLQRKCASCEEEKKPQLIGKHTPVTGMAAVTRMEAEGKEDEKVQREASGHEEKKEEPVQKKEAGGTSATSKSLSSYIASLPARGQGLPAQASQFFSSRMGYDLSRVKVHTGKEAADSAGSIHARAYTTGNHIVFNEGEYNPQTYEGKKLLAHELAHVMQQGQVIRRLAGTESGGTEDDVQPIAFSGKASNTEEKVAYGCAGINVQGQTRANYTDSYSSSGTTRPATTCESCAPAQCISSNGTIVSLFRARPVITLPSVPGGLTPCETQAVGNFINTTLQQHEQEHVNAFNTYSGTVNTPYQYTGCRSELNDYIRQLHETINSQRQANANALSDALDPFHADISCDCD
jgi:hypothetical protein